MSDATQALFTAFDGHDVESVRAALRAGADAITPVNGKSPITELLEQYTRSDRLIECLQLLFEKGAVLNDPVIKPVVLNDGDAVRREARSNPKFLTHRTSMASTFASLKGVSLLHVAAEYGHLDAARALIEAGADVNHRAERDEFGMNGHTPLFHTVNSNANRSEPIMRLLLDAGATSDLRIDGLVWGQGFEWETTFFDVTPISFAQMGLMPQVHRKERDIFANIRTLLKAAGRPIPPLENVPNKYLQS